ncbi:hypothetical protein JQX09_15310 [Sulfitobacter pseudonitzschiae]|uniref:Uncharacterized protein n=1 Tax=Pseudosulfitobacter pseudonitzschiae TaxID=1402135 RepID=A0A9Q2P2R9_9RHOB|nr:hypothetical protein [Pseudosulfitobacter pseudonitzschiae]MBM2293397.1 hypothetical protein [Pseudosulfitobacter pseudonitzschiae]MBM2298211.1 hypothetical protein [Pseudosulfitobacter pseudonitzschiae]MBM2303125.1 hypothetical protein [Pseudosulfitobacter pseudonitzschiae]MBM2312908.1 hypothetical protein [Pseudosulfitobacter pseudonitzschiae]MBM2317821.1 hypothetical protein [Pseudosulfitobacter pseudonitzschiae]
MEYVHAAAYSLIALVLLTGFGNVVCRRLFQYADLANKPEINASEVKPAGWIIGWLERLVIAIGIMTHSWEVLAAVIALKTVARFKELDDQSFAEYFLVGSLFSILWAVIITSAWLTYDRNFGMALQAKIAGIDIVSVESDDAVSERCKSASAVGHLYD